MFAFVAETVKVFVAEIETLDAFRYNEVSEVMVAECVKHFVAQVRPPKRLTRSATHKINKPLTASATKTHIALGARA